MAWHRRCLFGRHGPNVVRALCAYELVALVPRSPWPPITHFCRRSRPLAWAFVIALGHHLIVEQEISDLLDDIEALA